MRRLWRGKIGELFNEPGFSVVFRTSTAPRTSATANAAIWSAGCEAEDERRGERDGNDGHKGVAIEKRGSRMSENNGDGDWNEIQAAQEKCSARQSRPARTEPRCFRFLLRLPCGCFGHKNADERRDQQRNHEKR